jgi:hypothetical protein
VVDEVHLHHNPLKISTGQNKTKETATVIKLTIVLQSRELTIVLTAKGRDVPANRTRKARSPMSFSPTSRRLAKPLWTMAKMRMRANITTCKIFVSGLRF